MTMFGQQLQRQNRVSQHIHKAHIWTGHLRLLSDVMHVIVYVIKETERDWLIALKKNIYVKCYKNQNSSNREANINYL